MAQTLNLEKLDKVMYKVSTEVVVASCNYPTMQSAHEGFAILKEEVDELWEAVRMKQNDPERDKEMEKECIQVAAMAVRFLCDVCKNS